jgi:hypothetical protein
MAGFIQNIIWNSVEGFVDAAKKTGGEYAGNALIKAGDMIEGGGRSVGNGTSLLFTYQMCNSSSVLTGHRS